VKDKVLILFLKIPKGHLPFALTPSFLTMFLCICFLICLRMQVASSAKGVPSTGGLGGGFEICVN